MTTTPQIEDLILAEAWQWAWNTYPVTRRCLFHVPNELDRLPGETKQNHIRRLTQAKAKGVVPGVPDLLFVWRGRVYAWEFKTPTGTASNAQKILHPVWYAQGIPVAIVRSVEEFQSSFIKIIQP